MDHSQTPLVHALAHHLHFSDSKIVDLSSSTGLSSRKETFPWCFTGPIVFRRPLNWVVILTHKILVRFLQRHWPQREDHQNWSCRILNDIRDDRQIWEKCDFVHWPLKNLVNSFLKFGLQFQ
jgi:hypothetical protein